MTNVATGVYGMVEGRVIVSIDSSRNNHADNMYVVVLPPTHHDPSYLDVPYYDVHFPPYILPMLANLIVTKILNDVEGHVVPQNHTQSRSPLYTDKWIATERWGTSCIERNKVIGWNAPIFIIWRHIDHDHVRVRFKMDP